MRRNSLLFCLTIFSVVSHAQLTIQSGAQLFIQPGATVTVQGDITSNADILGGGILRLNGTAVQNLNLNGFTIPNLQIDNTNHILLTSEGRIGSSLEFIAGKFKTGNFNLVLADVASVTGSGAGKFIETNGTGQVRKLLTSDISAFSIPLGYSSNYTPVAITAAGTYAPGAYIGAHSDSGASANKPLRSTDFLNTYWSLTRSGITGTATAVASYNDATDVTGTESDLRGFIWDGTNWSLSGATVDASANSITANILPTGVNVYAMNRFVYLNSKIFLQGAYTGATISGTPVMNDNLRLSPNLIPTSDPYRTAPYNTSFTHINNSIAETVNPLVFSPTDPIRDLRNDIVDWVFVELRNTVTPGNEVLQTRSALLQRDGDVVEVDGVNPLYFKNIDASNFTVAVRHRNHLGISTDPNTLIKALNEQSSSLLNLTTTSDAQIFGSSAAYTTLNGLNLLWAGNSNGNTTVRYQGAGNDRGTILTDLGGNELTILTGYYRSDLNMNRQIRYQGAFNDRAYFLLTALFSNELTIRTQQLPN